MERRKPKLLIIGHARHGKDTFAELVADAMGLSFVSSSEFVGRVAIWPIWGNERYAAFSDCFDDRVNNRSVWFNLIAAYNTPDKARTGSEMMAAHDIYVGMRSLDEFTACMAKDLFDHVIWVDGSARHPPEGKDSNEMTKDLANIWIDNNGPEELMQKAVDSLQRRLHREGFEVNYVPTADDIIQMENIWKEDDKDIESSEMIIEQKPLSVTKAEPSNDETEDKLLRRLMKNPTLDIGEEAIRSYEATQRKLEKEKHEKMIVNPTLEESRKFHENAQRMGAAAIMKRSNNPPLDRKYTIVEDNSLAVGNMAVQIEDGPTASAYIPPQGKTVPDLTEPDYTDEHLQQLMDEADANPDQIPGWEMMPEHAVRVLDHGFFKVVEIMGSDNTIAESARMSYGRGTKKVSDDKGLINYLVRNKHTSPLEMGEIKFHIRMPIFVMRQWVRHRTANLNEYSGRYSEMVRLFYIPENAQVCLQDKVNKQGSAEPMSHENAEKRRKTMENSSNFAFDSYENLLAEGVSRETARIVLPLNTYTEVVWKLDISNLIKFLWLRDDDHAQWEIRQYAKMVAKAVKEYFPLVYNAYLEARQGQTFTMDEIRALITGDPDNLSVSQKQRLVLLRYNILS